MDVPVVVSTIVKVLQRYDAWVYVFDGNTIVWAASLSGRGKLVPLLTKVKTQGSMIVSVIDGVYADGPDG